LATATATITNIIPTITAVGVTTITAIIITITTITIITVVVEIFVDFKWCLLVFSYYYYFTSLVII
jgi:hypothetical protein